MGEPVRHRNLARIVADVKYDDLPHSTKITIFADPEILRKSSQKQIETYIKTQLEKVNIKSGTDVYSMSMAFNYPDADVLKDFDFGNVLIEANLPYCLHIPDHYEMKVVLPDEKIEALVTFRKFWTTRARTDEAESDNLDLVADNTALFFKKSTAVGPRLPLKNEDGWDYIVKAANTEKMNDNNGTFRYTKTYIQLKLDISKKEKQEIETKPDSLLDKIQKVGLNVVNKIIDGYRVVSNEPHVRRLGELKTVLIYFLPENSGFYLLSLNTSSAKMNIPFDDIKQLASDLKKGGKPETYKLLQLDAKDSFRNRDYTLAIVESFQALEIFLENFLISELKKKGKQENEIKEIMDTNWRTKDRLNIVLDIVKGTSLNKNNEIWDTWHTKYDKTRNEVIHYGRDATTQETEETLKVNEDVVKWLLSL